MFVLLGGAGSISQWDFRDMRRPLLACVPVFAQPGVTNHSNDKFFSSNVVNIQLNHVAEDDEASYSRFIRIKQLYEILFAPSYIAPTFYEWSKARQELYVF